MLNDVSGPNESFLLEPNGPVGPCAPVGPCGPATPAENKNTANC